MCCGECWVILVVVVISMDLVVSWWIGFECVFWLVFFLKLLLI